LAFLGSIVNSLGTVIWLVWPRCGLYYVNLGFFGILLVATSMYGRGDSALLVGTNMSLDTQKLHRLKGKSFDKLYSDHQNKWMEMVENARDYAQTCVGPNERVRIGDVVEVVQNAIRIDPMFEQHTKENEAKAIATTLLTTRFCAKPTSANPKVQAILTELLP
jgi:hypothetical protein